jgi:hypothetical protein
MAHFAEINHENQVLRVVVIGNSDCLDGNEQESEEVGISFCKSLFGDYTEWKQASYNCNFRKNYPSVGFYYDEATDAFIPPKPFDSWKLNEVTYQWEAPVSIPDQEDLENPISYYWDEQNQEWKKIEVPS